MESCLRLPLFRVFKMRSVRSLNIPAYVLANFLTDSLIRASSSRTL